MFLGQTEAELQADIQKLQAELASIQQQRQQAAAERARLEALIAQAQIKQQQPLPPPATTIGPAPAPLPIQTPGQTQPQVMDLMQIKNWIESKTGLPWYIPVGGGLFLLLLLR